MCESLIPDLLDVPLERAEGLRRTLSREREQVLQARLLKRSHVTLQLRLEVSLVALRQSPVSLLQWFVLGLTSSERCWLL